MKDKKSNESPIENNSDDKKENIVEIEKKKAIVTTPLEQLQAYGEIKDLRAGIKILFDDHYRRFIRTEKGKKDMEIAVQNISKLNMSKIIELYKAMQLPEELAFMIAIQETRATNKKSFAGARGLTGVMPATAKAFGYTSADLNDSYIANKITAKYLTTERKERFGNDIDMLLHAYNAGGGLFGFTKSVPREERTVENFYKYMEEYINRVYKEVKEKGYYTHTIDKKDKNLTTISKRFDISLNDLLKENNFTKETLIHCGDKIKIPYRNMNKAAKILFRKPFETLNYVPEIKAKYKAIKDLGFINSIENGTCDSGTLLVEKQV